MTIVSSGFSSYSSSSIFCVAIGSSALARLVEQQHLRLVGERARDAQALLLAAGQAERAVRSRSLTSSQSAARRSDVSTISSSSARVGLPLMRGP